MAHTRKAKASKKGASSAGRTSRFAGKTLTKLVKDNPRRKGTIGFKSFGVIKSGMTYEKYIAAGGRRQDLAFDIAHKYVKVA